MVFALPAFSLSDMVACSAELRRVGESASTMEAAASAVVRYLHEAFADPATGRSAFVLARAFKTERFDRLPSDLQDYVTNRYPHLDAQGQLRCLTLLATVGDEPSWQDRRRSVSHRAIALPSAEAVAAAPMISALIGDLGLLPGDVVHPPKVTAQRNDFDVFFVPKAAGSERIPAQDFVRAHRVRSALGFGGLLPGGDMFAVVLFARCPVPRSVADMFATLAVSTKVALLPYAAGPTFEGQSARRDARTGVSAHLAAVRQLLDVEEATARRQARRLEARERSLRHQVTVSRTLQDTGLALGSELDGERLVHLVTDAATRLTGAAYGAFFCDTPEADGQPYRLVALSGVKRSDFEAFPMPRNTGVFGSAFLRAGAVRSADITKDTRDGLDEPFAGMSPGRPPVRSYLAVPVVSRSGDVLGGLFFGHPGRGRFRAEHAQLAAGVAAQAATALDNARLYQRQRDTALQLQASLVPDVPARRASLRVTSRYLPGGTGAEVGGDWFDVIPLGAGSTALVIGDVMGRGVHAAALMGQVRTAVRAYAAMDLRPNEVLTHLNELVCGMKEDFIATCLFAFYDAAACSLTFANAGHMPPLLRDASGNVAFLELPVGTPIGVQRGHFATVEAPFDAGSRLLLYTDGLVETRDQDLSEGLAGLSARFAALLMRPGIDDDGLLAGLEIPGHEDDVALLLVHSDDPRARRSSRRFPAEPSATSAARRFARQRLQDWETGAPPDDVLIVVDELVANAVEHAGSPLELSLRAYTGGLVVEVFDDGAAPPVVMDADSQQEGHSGLVIVESLASRWGWRQHGRGKVVWADFEVAGQEE